MDRHDADTGVTGEAQHLATHLWRGVLLADSPSPYVAGPMVRPWERDDDGRGGHICLVAR